MPVVRAYSQNTQQLQPLPRERVRPADFGSGGEAIGRSAQRLGDEVADFARAQDQINAMYDEAAAKRADTQSMRAIAEATGKALTAEGFDAQPAVESARQEIERIRSEAIAALPTPRAQAMFSDVFERRVASDFTKLTDHSIKQVTVARRGEATARAEASIEDAVNNFGDPERFRASLDTAISELPVLFPGIGSEAMAQKVKGIRSKTHIQVIDSLMEKDPVAAEEWRIKHADEILSDDETKIIQKLAPGLSEANTDMAEGMLFELLETGQVQDGEGGTRKADDPDAPPPTAAQEARARVNADPLRGKGRVSETPTGHQARNGGTGRLAIDYAAPAGTPIYPPMSGKVVDKGFDPDGNGHYVRVEHPNGKVSTYLHMRGASPLNKGDEVTANTVLGGVGSTGRSTGNHLDFSVKDAKGRALDPTKVSWKEGDLPAYQPERNDKASMYTAAREVATRLNLSPKEYRALLGRVDQHVAREDGLRARAQEDVANKVWEKIVELGDNFTRLDQIPDFATLDPKEKQTVLNRMEQNIKGSEPEAYGGTYFDLLEASGSTDPRMQEQFLRTDLRRVNGITKGERAQLINRQSTMAKANEKGLTSNEVAADYSRISGSINRMIGLGVEVGFDIGKKADKEDIRRNAMLQERVQARYEQAAKAKGGRLTDAELEGIVRSEVISTTLVNNAGGATSRGDKPIPRYLAREAVAKGEATKGVVKVPSARAQEISVKFYNETRRWPSPGEILEIYTATGGR